MGGGGWDEAEYWRRRALGLPQPKEITLGPKCLQTPEQVVKDALKVLQEKLDKPRKKS